MTEAEVTALLELIRAGKASELTAFHEHDDGVVINNVSCATCRAERRLILAGRAFAAAQEG